MFFREYCKIFKKTYFEKHLQTGASETHLINTKLFIQILLCTLEFRIDGTSRLLIIPFFATLPNLIHHSLFINFELFQTFRLLIHVHSQHRWHEA